VVQLFKLSNLKWLLILMLGVVLVPAAHADTVYTLNEGCVGGCAASPFGQVDLSQDGNSVLVTVTLFNGNEFVKNGEGYALEFNIAGNQAVTETDLSTGFTSGSTADNSFGSFADNVWCNSACPAPSRTNSGPLTFLVSLTNGGTLTIDDFVTNSDGNYFASNIVTSDGDSTGIVASNDPIETQTAPEPCTVLLLGMGLASVVGLRRKKLAA
jgi:hypothetical protein